MKLYTIGHYNHSEEQFVKILKAADINFVADVRSFPGSRKSPQYKKENMKEWLTKSGINYNHFPTLGGRRNISGRIGEELNAGWENRSFHNYADYTLTEEFHHGIKDLKKKAEQHKLVMMCSERHPSRCHRIILSNYLHANGWEIIHIIGDSNGEAEFINHSLGKWGAAPIIEKDGTVVYPKV